jgi:hypothetical protein
MRTGARLKDWARAMKNDVVTLYIAARDPRVPWHVKAAAVIVALWTAAAGFLLWALWLTPVQLGPSSEG